MTAVDPAPAFLPQHPHPDWTLRPLASPDLPGVLALDDTCFGGIWTEGGYRREIESPNSTLLILETADAPALVGVGCCWAILDEAHITLLGIHPDWRGRGLGQYLLATLLQAARDRHLTRATLEVRASNRRALDLYEKFGFRTAGERKNYYQDPQENALILWRNHLDWPEYGKSLDTLAQQAQARAFLRLSDS